MEDNLLKLTEITEEDWKTGVKDRYGVIYSRDGKRLLKCVNDRLEKYKIRKGTEVICDCAFEEEYDGEHLMCIEIPDSVMAIGNGAFHGCVCLHQISIPDTVMYIGGWAFGKCESLCQLTLPASLKCIEGNPFCGCHYLNLKSNSSLFSVKDDLLIDNDKRRLVAYLGHAESVNIPDSIINIDEAFWGCKSLKQVTIPNSVQTIGFRAFFGCDSLQQIVIPDSVKNIEDYAFEWCDSLQQIIIPNSITTIERDVFSCCWSLRQITIPDSVETIGEGAFSECESLEQIKIPASVTHIDEYAFYGCKSLQEIVLTESIKDIGENAFKNCESLKKIIIRGHFTDKVKKMLPKELQKIAKRVEYVPNAETLAAFEEAKRIMHDPNAKGFKNIDELFDYLSKDDDDEENTK